MEGDFHNTGIRLNNSNFQWISQGNLLMRPLPLRYNGATFCWSSSTANPHDFGVGARQHVFNNTETEIFCGLSQSCWNISDGESLRIILMLTLFVGKITASRRASTVSHHEIYGPAVPLDLECLPWHPWNANEHLFERMQVLLPRLFFKLLTIPSVELLSNTT